MLAEGNTYEVDTFHTRSGKVVEFHALHHSSIRLVFDGRELQIDPVRRRGNHIVDYTSMPKAHYIFVTHEHGDHFDKAAIHDLSDAGTSLVTNQRCSDMLGYGLKLRNGEGMELAPDIRVYAVPAYNTTPDHQKFHPKGRDNGYVLTIDGLRIYVAGDTEDIPEMSDIKDIDVAFLPCNQPYTMTPEQLIRAARVLRPRVLFPYHYGRTDVSGLPKELQKDGIDVRIRHYE